jgi:uncharacterized Zn finger protein
MSRGGWAEFEYRPRIKADGIKAKTGRGKFGQTWWAGRWIAALERLVDAGRLSRGRTYARGGQVLTLDVGRDGVAAKVQGSRPTPYKVSIAFKRLADAEWDTVADVMAERAIYAARLLAGEMPEGIEEVFAASGTPLFPAAANDLTTRCSCPDWSNPCKHVAAVHYLLGERFDEDPFLIFELRGRNRDAITAMLRARRIGEGAAVDTGPAEAEDGDAPDEEDRAGDTPEAFWSLPAEAYELPLRFEPAEVDALPVKRLGPPAFMRDPERFVAAMEQAYAAIAAYAYRTAEG